MNRRNFFNAVTGFIAGVCAAFVPNAKAKFSTEDFGGWNPKDGWKGGHYGQFKQASMKNQKKAPLKIFNGQVFEAPWPLCHTVIVLYFGRDDLWILLSSPYSSRHNGSAMMVCYYGRENYLDNPFYTQKELQEKLKDWTLVEDKLILDRSRGLFCTDISNMAKEKINGSRN